MKDLKVVKIAKGIKFEGVWGKLEAKKCFQRKSFTKCLRLTLVFVRKVHYGKNLISVFQGFLPSIDKISIFAGDWAPCYHSMGFRHFPEMS